MKPQPRHPWRAALASVPSAKRWLAAALLALALPAAAQELKPFTPESLAQITASHAGTPFVLAFWSLTCAHCQQELADFGRRPIINLVLVSTDTPADGDAIRATLARHGLEKAEAWVFADDFAERLRYAVDRDWTGELPRSYFYAADGSRRAVTGRPEAALLKRWLGAARTARKSPDSSG